ncbi:DegQ family serine endoprotease [Agrobacterium rosae]|uniref:DegQ family serine endoprotease n=2 Tax=Pseudomonadota TaxID=1224 RepID=A0AAE5RYR4_9HYPH|nr:DegQ family serine endoprotease [Agrobacterium rosae]KAA3512266.1 DegQ family serine endoprotease [Agrobacterium rosae]KAA3520285.1 DegQ family serine endoprotease [Agrobacterium rosae]MCM2432164.1 DegQ family serine endoprotease [Agrobacterium rosae]MDX8327697.1 DegQ family serine endoprotease [Agrobacterium rosae]MQB48882.1 DegQ family serine endoprotease [Agrobacterium rosae]
MPSMLNYLTTGFLATMLALPVPVQAQDNKTVPASTAEMQLSFAPLVKRTAGAVVNVYAERLVQKRASPFAGDPFFEQFFGQQSPNRTEKQSSLGSGVIATASGLVVTNNHVIDGADDIKVALADGREFASKVLLKDDRLDLAVLQIDAKEEFPVLALGNSDATEVGDLVLAIGNPFGVGQTVTSGIVSALARNQVTQGDFGFFIQTDASINPGNSGGALMNMAGELIGINTAIFSRGGGSNGIGFAIPANLVRVFLAAAEKGETSFQRPYVGATFDPVTSEVAEALGLKRARGALVVGVVKDGPAEKAGIEPGQVVTAVNGIPVEHPDALGYRLTTAGIGKSATITLIDKGKEKNVTIALDTAPETAPRDERLLEGRNPFAGATVANLSPKLADELRMPTSTSGVVIMDVKRNSPAARVGFQPKDIIVSLNGTDMTSTANVEKALEDNPGFWRLEIIRDGQRIRQFLR